MIIIYPFFFRQPCLLAAFRLLFYFLEKKAHSSLLVGSISQQTRLCCHISESDFEFHLHFKCYLSCSNLWALVACKNSWCSEAVCFLPSTFVPQTEMYSELSGNNVVACWFPANNLKFHVTSGCSRSSRIDLTNHQKASSSSKRFCMAFGAHCTLNRMISYLLLLNEHKEFLGLGFPWQSNYLLPRTHFIPLLSATVKRPTHLALDFYTYKEKKHFEYDACWTRCLNQTYENTNLQLLSVWRGFPDGNKRLGFPKPELEVQFVSEVKWKPYFNPGWYILYDWQQTRAVCRSASGRENIIFC